MEFKEVKTHLEYLKSLKKRNEISEFGENLIKELETLLEQREKMLELLIRFKDADEFDIIDFMDLKLLIKEATEL
jgi:hypothetical protein